MAKTTKRDYYEILGLSPDADAKAIKQAFKRLAMKYHPDRNKSADAEARFKEVAEAYAVLSDPKKRASYDARGHAGVSGFSADDLFRDIDFGEIFGQGFAGFGLGDDLFSRFFGDVRRPEPRVVRGGNIHTTLELPLEKIAQGGSEKIRFLRPRSCPHCHGSGADPAHPPRDCSACGGTGMRVERSQRQGILFQQSSTCPVCHGQGQIIDKLCPQCGGQGQLEEEETLELKIPPGIEEGMTLRVPGHGQPSVAAGGEAGDLYVIVRSRPDPRFERHGRDLWRSEILAIAEAVLGCSRQVPTLDGMVKMNIPPATQPDEVLRLRGKGLPGYRDPLRGDLLVRIRVEIPRKLSGEQRRLYEALLKLEKS
jgi:molecular chaperone DnaJ